MTRTELLDLILAHLKKSKEGRYAWSARVMRDKAFLFKLAKYDRTPYQRTQNKIKRAIRRKEASMKARKAVGRRGV